MLRYKAAEKLRVITFDVFVLGMVVSRKSGNRIANLTGISDFIDKWITEKFIEYGPLYISVILGAVFAITSPGGLSFINISKGLIKIFFGTNTVVLSAEKIRSSLFTDCIDHVREVKVRRKPKNDILASIGDNDAASQITLYDNKFAIQQQEQLSPKIGDSTCEHYTRELPDKTKMFLETSPVSKDGFCYQNDFEEMPSTSQFNIDTLNGRLRSRRQVNGNWKLEWESMQNKKKSIEQSKYIPLDKRTKTLNDLKELDSTNNRESANRIIKAIQAEKLKAIIILDALDDME